MIEDLKDKEAQAIVEGRRREGKYPSWDPVLDRFVYPDEFEIADEIVPLAKAVENLEQTA
jgi:hypothetical protein